MAYTITLQPSGRSFEASSNETLLKSAEQAGFKLPYGCSAGACGVCKALVTKGAVEHCSYQDNALTIDEMATGMALLCRATPLSDLTVAVREINAMEGITVRKMPCRVQKMVRAAPDVMVLHLKPPASEPLHFLAGQYLEILRSDGSRRAFSIANAPYQTEFIELHIRLVSGGKFTTQVFDSMKEKEILRIEAPLGTFFLREESTKPIILLAGGTGFAPIKGLVEHSLHKGYTRPIHLYWGAQNRSGLYMDGLVRSWVEAHAHIQYTPVLSDALITDAWSGRTGLVHQAVLEDCPDLAAYEVYACGAPIMIDSAHRDFTARGLPAGAFFADAFTFDSHG